MSKYIRQLDLINNKKLDIPIHILGSGGIGSWTALLLAKIGYNNITIYDDDKVEIHNTASQFFSENQIEELKIDALKENIKLQTNIDIKTANIISENYINNGIVILALDSLEARRQKAEMFKDRDIFIIDGRMGGLQLEIYACEAMEYEKTIPENADVDACTARAIAFNCAIIGGLIANMVRQYCKDGINIKTFRMELNYLNTLYS